MKEGEGVSQRTYVLDTETQRTVKWWPEGRGAQGLGGGEQSGGGAMGTSVIVLTIKIKL